tara:strand:- start:14 stop:595 length:582 start_codon:yes stop_codon:yes gene_type:complete
LSKKILQLSLFLFLILVSVYFYYEYFKFDEKGDVKNTTELNLEKSNSTKNNLIKNLKYEIQFNDKTMYNITADSSEIKYENDGEIVSMKVVTAVLTDENNITITVTSDDAIYNSTNYNSQFRNNVKIIYLDHIILSDKMDINFDENIANIYDNVFYEGVQGTLKSDNIKINLISKDIEIFMKESNDKVKIISK